MCSFRLHAFLTQSGQVTEEKLRLHVACIVSAASLIADEFKLMGPSIMKYANLSDTLLSIKYFFRRIL